MIAPRTGRSVKTVATALRRSGITADVRRRWRWFRQSPLWVMHCEVSVMRVNDTEVQSDCPIPVVRVV
ncbi:hypothetical protein Pd630_LPD16054 (plasmid) [Rhodococcus opacus PD630]|nr:hypothetical protein Pd630_LPD16054 [Rhodococcus opacus PD630]